MDGFWDYAVENSGFGQRLQDFYDQLVENSSTPDFTLKQYILSSNFLKVPSLTTPSLSPKNLICLTSGRLVNVNGLQLGLIFFQVTVRMEGFEQLTLIDKPKYSIAAILSTVSKSLLAQVVQAPSDSRNSGSLGLAGRGGAQLLERHHAHHPRRALRPALPDCVRRRRRAQILRSGQGAAHQAMNQACGQINRKRKSRTKSEQALVKVRGFSDSL